MFGTLGGPEIVLILVIALIVFGPRKLPEIGKTMGKMLAEFRKASSDFKRTIEDEVEAEKVLPAVAEGPAPVAVAAGSSRSPSRSRAGPTRDAHREPPGGRRIQPPAAMETPSRLEPPAPLDSTRTRARRGSGRDGRRDQARLKRRLMGKADPDKMSFLEHLDELRSRLIKVVLWLIGEPLSAGRSATPSSTSSRSRSACTIRTSSSSSPARPRR